jgi:hypothetical protein
VDFARLIQVGKIMHFHAVSVPLNLLLSRFFSAMTSGTNQTLINFALVGTLLPRGHV